LQKCNDVIGILRDSGKMRWFCGGKYTKRGKNAGLGIEIWREMW